jgi:hypothetical protein
VPRRAVWNAIRFITAPSLFILEGIPIQVFPSDKGRCSLHPRPEPKWMQQVRWNASLTRGAAATQILSGGIRPLVPRYFPQSLQILVAPPTAPSRNYWTGGADRLGVVDEVPLDEN